MEFELSTSQQQLRDAARDELRKVCPSSRVRALFDEGATCDPALARLPAERGWLGLHLPAARGGLGKGLVELAVVAEETGRVCLPGPFLPNVWSATLLAEIERSPAAARCLSAVLAGEINATVAMLEDEADWRVYAQWCTVDMAGGRRLLNGGKAFVLEAASAQTLLCVAHQREGLAIVAVPAGARGLSIEATPAFDSSRKFYEVKFDAVEIDDWQLLAVGEAARAALERSLQVAAAATCAEMLGVMQWTLETTVAYARTRQQFGRSIGSFQAVQHQCADMLLLTESSRSATYYAAWSLAAHEPDAAKAVSVAKAYCSDAAREVCHRGVQIHGGIGFIWDNDLHLYLRRVKACEYLFGNAEFHREEIARLILDAPVE